ncbi:MAG: DNA methyltransferase [Saccharofermentanaceae bacterium]|jgi:site-specific DNA-methyltransferase (adenine-specific)
MIELIKGDNLPFMATCKDKQFDLAVVDPPYGLGFGNFNRTNKSDTGVRMKANRYKNSDWDAGVPMDLYFTELFRISKNQIIWGGNYFIQVAKIESPNLKTKQEFIKYINRSESKWIFWYKQNPVPNFADGELAWISFNESSEYDYMYYGNINSESDRCHPTQKPVQLYKWLLKNYAKPGDTILNTHLGSGSSVIACIDGGFDFTGIELDSDYFEAMVKRVKNHVKQLDLFIERPEIKIIR